VSPKKVPIFGLLEGKRLVKVPRIKDLSAEPVPSPKGNTVGKYPPYKNDELETYMIRLCSVVRDGPQLCAENELVGVPFLLVTPDTTTRALGIRLRFTVVPCSQVLSAHSDNLSSSVHL